MDSDKSFLISSFSFLTLTEITQNPNNNDDKDNIHNIKFKKEKNIK